MKHQHALPYLTDRANHETYLSIVAETELWTAIRHIIIWKESEIDRVTFSQMRRKILMPSFQSSFFDSMNTDSVIFSPLSRDLNAALIAVLVLSLSLRFLVCERSVKCRGCYHYAIMALMLFSNMPTMLYWFLALFTVYSSCYKFSLLIKLSVP